MPGRKKRTPDPYARKALRWREVACLSGIGRILEAKSKGEVFRRVEFVKELKDRVARLTRGHDRVTDNRLDYLSLESALIALGRSAQLAGFLNGMVLNSDAIGAGMVKALGEDVVRLLSADTVESVENAAGRLELLFSGAVRGLVSERLLLLGKARGSRGIGGDLAPRPAVAILATYRLSKKEGRFPTRSEVISLLKDQGIHYAPNKNEKRNWEQLFSNAGLDALK
jgi:hypothetical protein